MKKFLFITHLTPRNKRSSLRNDLIEVMTRSLHGQSYVNWKALWIGEEETQAGPIKTVSVNGENREVLIPDLRRTYEREDVKSYINDSDYVVKLDDDDVISESALERASRLDFDCYCDLFHTFYDVASGSITNEKRSWIASTAIHKKEHAFTDLRGNGAASNFLDSVFYGDHGQDWIKYYADKKIVYASKKEPLYIRVLSPISYTAGAGLKPRVSLSDIDLDSYNQYLKQFGAWNEAKVSGFGKYIPLLDQVWERFSNSPQKPISGIPYTMKVKRRIKDLLNG